ncbi:MAG: tRNA dihydrouridine synthase DusB [Planctomycetota bacterium]
MQYGSLKLENNLVAAPLAGISNRAYRVLCKRYGAGLTYVEMLKVESFLHHNRKMMTLKYYRDDERPVGIQFAGNNPKWLAEACKMAEDEGYDTIDLNMGCPVPKIGKCGAGSALMAFPDTARECFKAMVGSVNIPVTVKIRAGVNESELNFVEIGKMAQEEGMVAITIHPRTRAQSYKGIADHTRTGELKAALDIPVIASGDVKEPEDAIKILDEQGCDGIMLGRGVWGRPWLFREIDELQKHGQIITPTPDAIERLGVLREHFEMLLETFEPKRACQVVRRYATWYIKGIPGSAHYRKQITKVETAVEFHEVMDEITEHFESICMV